MQQGRSTLRPYSSKPIALPPQAIRSIAGGVERVPLIRCCYTGQCIVSEGETCCPRSDASASQGGAGELVPPTAGRCGAGD